mmetsp:Transcript_6942/g.13346  ORF Transcript_6942/g.13346 Transcript_6942/m.13346 type:complete len:245 (-) Transcript_6942:138-872(-)
MGIRTRKLESVAKLLGVRMPSLVGRSVKRGNRSELTSRRILISKDRRHEVVKEGIGGDFLQGFRNNGRFGGIETITQTIFRWVHRKLFRVSDSAVALIDIISQLLRRFWMQQAWNDHAAVCHELIDGCFNGSIGIDQQVRWITSRQIICCTVAMVIGLLLDQVLVVSFVLIQKSRVVFRVEMLNKENEKQRQKQSCQGKIHHDGSHNSKESIRFGRFNICRCVGGCHLDVDTSLHGENFFFFFC